MKSKNAQLSVFILIGIMLLISMVFFLSNKFDKQETIILDSSDSKTNINFGAEFSPFNSVFENCISNVSESGFDFMLAQNGDYELGTYNSSPQFRYQVFAVHSKRSFEFIELNRIEITKNLSRYVEDALPNCVENSSEVLLDNFEVSFLDSPNVESYELGDSIVVKGKFPIEVSTNESKIVFNSISYRIENIPFDKIEEDFNIFSTSYKYALQAYYTPVRDDANQAYVDSVNLIRSSGTKVNFYPIKDDRGNTQYRVVFSYGEPYRESNYIFGVHTKYR